MNLVSYALYVLVAVAISRWLLRRLWGPLRRGRTRSLGSFVTGIILVLVVLIIAVLVYGSERNNDALINSLIISAILIAIAIGIFYAVRNQGFALRTVAAMLSLILIGAAFGRSCSTQVGDSVRYAALGDSFASGEGARVSGHPYVNRLEYGPAANGETDDPRCHRSTEAYPGVLADGVGRTSLLFTACSGAKIADLTTTAQYDATPPQLETLNRWVASGAPDFVTVTIGGNDLGFADILAACVKARCAPGDPTGEMATFESKLAGLSGQLTLTYLAIRKIIGTHVPVIVVGYPQILPTSATCPSLAGLDDIELAGMRDAWIRADDVIRTAASAAGAYFVDTSNIFEDHLICSSEPYAHGLNLPSAVASTVGGDYYSGAFHPTPDGHECIARTIMATYALPRALPDPPPIGTSNSVEPAIGSSSPCP